LGCHLFRILLFLREEQFMGARRGWKSCGFPHAGLIRARLKANQRLPRQEGRKPCPPRQSLIADSLIARSYFGCSATLPPPVEFALRSAFTFLVLSALATQSSATLICFSYSSLLSARSAFSRMSRFSYAMASSYSGSICSDLSSATRPASITGP